MTKCEMHQPQHASKSEQHTDNRRLYKLIGWAMLAGTVVPAGIAVGNHIESVKAEIAAEEAHNLGNQDRSDQLGEIAATHIEARNASAAVALSFAGGGAGSFMVAAAAGPRGGARRRQEIDHHQDETVGLGEQPAPYPLQAEQSTVPPVEPLAERPHEQ